mgnify:CR=1 FL=1
MGFLNGAYGKLMAGKLVRDIQYQLTGVQSQLRRVTRQVGDMEKMFTRQQRNMKAQLQSQMQASMYGAMDWLGIPGFDMNMSGADAMGAYSNLSQTQKTEFAQAQQMVQMRFASAQNMWESMFEMQREAMLQPLKDLEDDLQTQKDNLESRLKIATAEYDAKKKEEQDGAKNLTPDYTGQG